jgi:drug/metabolite transporter (DMT)-like permease
VRSPRLGVYAALTAIGIGWGGSVVASKTAVSTGHDPLGLVFWQMLIAAAVLVAGCSSSSRGTSPRECCRS